MYLRAFQGRSGRNLVDPTLQDNVLIPDGFFQYICHIGCAINLHSIINSGLILGGQILSDRQSFFLLVDPMDKEHKDPDTIDLEALRLAQYMQKAWKKHQNMVYGSTSNLLKRKDWISIRRDQTLSFFAIHSKLIVSRKLFGRKLEKSYTKKYMNHLECLRRFPRDMIGWMNWFQKLLDKQKSTNQPNQTLIEIMIERWDPLWQNKRFVRVLRKSIHVSLVTARIPNWLLNV